MLREFVAEHREEIIRRAQVKVRSRAATGSSEHLESGVPLFLTQLVTLLELVEQQGYSDDAIAAAATTHGGNLTALGFTIRQVVHDYGDVCQAVTELALELQAPISVDEFHTLNKCLDTAIAEAVTEHARLTSEAQTSVQVRRTAHVAHDLRDSLQTAILAFNALKTGTIAITGNTGTVLGRSLLALRTIIDRSIAEARMSGSGLMIEAVPVGRLLDDLVEPSSLAAESRGVRFCVEGGNRQALINCDAPVMVAAVMNLVSNAIKFTRPNGQVILRTKVEGDVLRIEIEDECGGFPEMPGDPFEPFVLRRSTDHSGLGLGLSIARQAVRAHAGDITVHNRPAVGCMFLISLPLAVTAHVAAVTA
jgi:signal transduction histidine kinase